MEKQYYWYVIFTLTGCEESVVCEFEKWFKDQDFKPFIPMRETIFRRKGINKKEKEKMFPGYMFVETAIASKDFLQTTSNFICSQSNKAIRVLRYGDGNAAINKEEIKFLHYLLGNKKCVETSIGFKEGDKIIIEHGPLQGYESIVKKINYHKREAVIELNILNEKRSIIIPIEIITKMEVCVKK
jgi:transcriptional antiterminator NusG